MRLGNLDALKEELKRYFSDGVLDNISAKLAFNMILRKIDDSPTIPQPDYKDGYKQAIIDGKTNFNNKGGKK